MTAKAVMNSNSASSALSVCNIQKRWCYGQHMFGLTPINDDTWRHLALTVDRDASMILYRDGEIEIQADIAASKKENEDNGKNFNIGAQAGSQTIRGMIDEVGIFNIVLTQDSVKNVMNKGLQRELGFTSVSPLGKLPCIWGQTRKLSKD